MVGIIAGILLAQPDTGTLIVIAVTAIGMFLVGGGSWKHALGLILIISIGVMILASFEQYFYIKDRFLTYFDPEGTRMGRDIKYNNLLLQLVPAECLVGALEKYTKI